MPSQSCSMLCLLFLLGSALAVNPEAPKVKLSAPAQKSEAKPLAKPLAPVKLSAPAQKSEAKPLAKPLLAKPVLSRAPAAKATVLAAHSNKFVPNTNPILVPESDKLFFGKDYPTDERPNVEQYYKGKAGKGFDYPFPKVQKSSEYDKDYIKDENNDNGEWKVQTDYDFARAKLKKEAKEREEARKAYEKEHGDIAGADAASDAADAEWEKAHKESAAAADAKRAEDGKTVVDSGIGDNGTHNGTSTSTTDMDKAIAEAEANYAREQKEFEKCKQELDAAKAELDRVKALAAATALQAKQHTEQMKKERAEFEVKKASHAQEIAQKNANLEKEKSAVTNLKVAADDKVAEALKKKDAANKKAAKEKAEAEAAKKALEKEEAQFKKAEQDLEKATAKLKGKKEPASSIFHSGATRGSAVTPALLALALAVARAFC